MNKLIYAAALVLAYWLGSSVGYHLARVKMLNAVRRWMQLELKKDHVPMSSYQTFNIVMEMLRGRK